MKVNRGKQFEDNIRKTLESMDNVVCQRLYDNMGGFVNIKYPADFIVFRSPKLIYLECKSIHGASIPLANLTQLDRLCETVKDKKDVSGKFLIWFVDKQCTFLVDCFYIKNVRDSIIGHTVKSLNYQTLRQNCAHLIKEVPAVYPRVNGKYDLRILFEE